VEDKNREHQLQLAHVARLSTLGEMASGIAHELNQPLTVINNYSRACIRMLEANESNPEPMEKQCVGSRIYRLDVRFDVIYYVVCDAD
jgi:two-component system sensor histidine kinase TtrS